MVFGATAQAQSEPDAEVKALIAKIDAARGKPKQPASIAMEGTYEVTFAGAPGGEPVAKGKVREIFSGSDRARQTSEMGEYGAMERGIKGDLTWELDPAMGAKVFVGAQAVTVRRFFAMLRGASPTELYAQIARSGTEQLEGRPHVVLRMSPPEGKPDTWFVDAENGDVSRVDTTLPAPESADATFDMGDWIEAQVRFADWKKVDGVRYPHRRTMKMGPATVAVAFTKIETGVKLEPASFTPPQAVLELESKPPAKPTDADGKPTYEIVERKAQPVASIRVKCKPQGISATLAVVLPEVMEYLNASGGKMAGAPFSRYHAFGPAEVDLEAGIPVAKPITESGRVKNGELPAGRAVTAWHIGPYEKLGDAHQALQAYLDANQLKPRGGPWEIYWTDPGMVPDPAKWRTQLFMPIEQ